MRRVTFSPNMVQQARMATDGLLGDFVIRYDVQRDAGVGDIQVKVRLDAWSSGVAATFPLSVLCPRS